MTLNITRNKLLTGNLNTNLYDILKTLSNVPLYHLDHKIRPPIGIYNVSSSRVLNAFDEIVHHFYNSNSKPEDLSKAHIELLEALMAFIDDTVITL